MEADGFNFWERLEINIFVGLNQEKEKIEVRDDSSFQSKLCSPWRAQMTDRGCVFIYVVVVVVVFI